MTEAIKRAQTLEQEYHIQLYRRYPLTLVKGEGPRVWDSEGNEYLDALAGIAVTSLGQPSRGGQGNPGAGGKADPCLKLLLQ